MRLPTKPALDLQTRRGKQSLQWNQSAEGFNAIMQHIEFQIE